jgi:hypothetical protein
MVRARKGAFIAYNLKLGFFWWQIKEGVMPDRESLSSLAGGGFGRMGVGERV